MIEPPPSATITYGCGTAASNSAQPHEILRIRVCDDVDGGNDGSARLDRDPRRCLAEYLAEVGYEAREGSALPLLSRRSWPREDKVLETDPC
jgi:hypothetical protein